MPDQELVQRLLEELLESGRSVEDVCKDHPELLQQMRERWQGLRHVQAQVDELFPTNAPDEHPTTGAGLPTIPGYVLEGELGRGGMGVVYRARHERLRRQVALKMLLTGRFATPQELLRFQREAELVAQLRHPNIVTIHDVGDVDGQPFYTMEIVDGPSLAEAQRKERLPIGPAVRLVAVLARAIEFAHQQGIVHRDLKPANILIAADGTPKISDFGLARRVGSASLTRTGARVGTPSYMAPEQAMGQTATIGPATDVYSLGTVLYELLTGKPPFGADSDAATTRLVIEAEPPRPRLLNPGIPRDLETICLCCLRKEPHRRYASAALLAHDLESFANGGPILARRPRLTERLWMWGRRRPALAAALGSCAVLALLLLAGALWLLSDRAAQLRMVEGDLQTAQQLVRTAAWPAANASLASAEARLGTLAAPDLRERLAGHQRDLDLAVRLEQIRVLPRLTILGNRIVHVDPQHSLDAYANALAPLGFDEAKDADAAAAWVRASDIRMTIVEALDDWATQPSGPGDYARRAWLLRVARLADPDPTGWRDRVRDPASWGDADTLRTLATTAEVESQPVPLLLILVDRLRAAGDDPTPLLRRIIDEHPQDFWANFAIGMQFTKTKVAETVRYFQAAVALRPEAAAAHGNLGIALAANGRLPEAETHLRRAVALGGADHWPHTNLGNGLLRMDRRADAKAAFELALQRDARATSAMVGLAAVMRLAGDLPGALEQLRRAEAIDADKALVLQGLAVVLLDTGKLAEAVPYFERALVDEPDNYQIHQNYGRLLKSQNKLPEAVARFQRAVELAPNDGESRSLLAKVLMNDGQVDAALAQAREGVRLDPANGARHHDLGFILAVDWQLEAAIAAFTTSLQLAPDDQLAQGALAQALLVGGDVAGAVTAAQRYVELAPPAASARAAATLRHAERLAELSSRSPASGADDVAAIDCMYLARHVARAGRFAEAIAWYERAFAGQPALANDLRRATRHHAAITALRAAVAADAAADTATGEWMREKAHTWLHDDLAFRRNLSPTANARDVKLMRYYVQAWTTDPALSAVRDAHRLLELPADEREVWLQLWRDVDVWLRDSAPR